MYAYVIVLPIRIENFKCFEYAIEICYGFLQFESVWTSFDRLKLMQLLFKSSSNCQNFMP